MSRFGRRIERKQNPKVKGPGSAFSPELLARASARLGQDLKPNQKPRGKAMEGMPKLSQSLIAYAQPVLRPLGPGAHNDMYRSAFSFAVLCWNLGLLEHQDGPASTTALRAQMTAMIADAPPKEQDEIKSVFEKLLADRVAVYGDDPRLIVDFDVKDRGNSYDLSVVGAPRAGKAETA